MLNWFKSHLYKIGSAKAPKTMPLKYHLPSTFAARPPPESPMHGPLPFFGPVHSVRSEVMCLKIDFDRKHLLVGTMGMRIFRGVVKVPLALSLLRPQPTKIWAFLDLNGLAVLGHRQIGRMNCINWTGLTVRTAMSASSLPSRYSGCMMMDFAAISSLPASVRSLKLWPPNANWISWGLRTVLSPIE